MQVLSAQDYIFLLHGLKWTVLLSIIAFIGGGLFGTAIALARASESKMLRAMTAAFISCFQGTPLVLQLFVIYYGIALTGLRIDPWLSVSAAFTLHAAAFLGEIWRGCIEAIPRGQAEAAKALGLQYAARMWLVILPQAWRLSLPATIGYLVQQVKGTSLAAIVGFTELARAGIIISNQLYRPLLVFSVVGLLYFLICWPLSLFGSSLEGKKSPR